MPDLFSAPLSSLPAELRAVGEMIEAASRTAPVKNAAIACATGLSERSVKEAVERLRREHYWPVLGSKRPPYGYFVARTRADLEEAAWGLISQGVTMIRTGEAMVGKQRAAEIAGQIRIGECA